MPSKKREIVLNGYRFVGLAHRIAVISKGKKDEEELKAIAKLYEEHYVSSRRGGVLLKGEWRWCLNPECNKAVYVSSSEIRVSKGKIVCSHYCANKVRGLPSPAPPKVAKAIEEGMMLDNKKGNTVVTEGHTFIISGRQIIIASKGNKDEEELRVITKAYEKYKHRCKYAGRPLNGEFRWCMNPECNNAFYARRDKIEQGQASFCCRRCSSKVTGCPKGQQIGKIIHKPDRLTKTEVQKEKRQRKQTEEKKEMPVGLETKEVVCWILDAVFYKDPDRIEQLNLLLKISDKEIKSALNEIFREIPGCGPAYPAARRIIESYIQSEEGKDLRVPIQTLVGILFFIPSRF